MSFYCSHARARTHIEVSTVFGQLFYTHDMRHDYYQKTHGKIIAVQTRYKRRSLRTSRIQKGANSRSNIQTRQHKGYGHLLSMENRWPTQMDGWVNNIVRDKQNMDNRVLKADKKLLLDRKHKTEVTRRTL